MVVICREMGWDYYQFINQPIWFIQAIDEMLYEEYKQQKRNSQRIKV